MAAPQINIVQSIVYGIIQGLTEFLPVSSNAHIRIAPALMGWEDPGAGFTAVIQLGTVLAVLIYFWKDLSAAFKGWLGSITGSVPKDSHDAKVGWAVLYATIPVVIVGLALHHKIETTFRSLHYISFSLIAMGILMMVADRIAVHREGRTLESVTPKDGVIVGLWQCLALVPGMSRSGSTITGALFNGFNRGEAARFSFLMSIPSITAAGLYEAFKERKSLGGDLLPPTLIATVVSFVVGYAVIAWFIKFVQKRGIGVFVAYRIALAALLIFLVMSGKLAADEGAAPVKEPEVSTQQ